VLNVEWDKNKDMKKFIFRFETLLGIRKRKEDEIAKELAIFMRLLSEERYYLQKMQSSHLENQENLKQNIIENINITETILYEQYLIKLSNDIKVQKAKIDSMVKKELEIRDNLIKASKNKKTIEKLKKRDHLKYRTNIIKQENKMLDEVGTIQYARNKK